MFAFITVVSVTSANAQTKKKVSVDVKAKAATKSRGANPHIKSEAPTTDKAVAKSRGADCSVNFDNYTGLYVKVYVDGYYKGTVAPYSNGTVTVGEGYTTIYCVSTGGTQEWNASGNCEGSYTYKLRYN